MKLLAAAFALWLCAPGQDFDRSRHVWARWKVDSFARYKLGVEAVGQTLDGEYKVTLAELKEKTVTTRHWTSFLGGEQEETEVETIPERKGEEKVKVGDKEYDCVVWSSSAKRGEREGVTRTWISSAHEIELKVSWKIGENESGEFTATKLSDTVKVAGRDLDCVLLEGEMTTHELGTVKGKLWMSARVPGGMVKMEVASDEAKIRFELIEFEGKK